MSGRKSQDARDLYREREATRWERSVIRRAERRAQSTDRALASRAITATLRGSL